MTKKRTYFPLTTVSPNTVKRILQDVGLWPEGESPAKKGGRKPLAAQPKRPGKP